MRARHLLPLLCVACATPFRDKVEISQAQMQQRIDGSYIAEKRLLFAQLTLDGPELVFRPQPDRLGLKTNVHLRGAGLHEDGVVEVQGELRYDKATTEFYIRNIEVVALDMQRLEPRHQAAVRRVTAELLEDYLAQTPVYMLSEEQASRGTVRKLNVKDGVVIAELGI